jgi:hypothetical protein
MKKVVSILSIFATTVAIASSVQSDNTFGVLKLDIGTAAGQTIISVPWENVGGGDIEVDKIMLTNNLAVDDQLWYFNQVNKKYQVWKLTATGWAAQDVVSESKEVALDDTTVPRGSALIIERNTVGANGNVYLYGQYTASTATNSIAYNSDAEVFSLIAPTATTGSTVNLNLDLDYEGTPLVGDQIIQGAGDIYTYRVPSAGGGEKWCKSTWEQVDGGKLQTFVTTGVTLPVGKGAWYRRQQGNAPLSLIWK